MIGNRLTRVVTLLPWLFAACSSPGPGDDAGWAPPALTDDAAEDPDPRAIVRRMTDFIGGHEELMLEALVSYGALQESGQMLHFDLLQRMAIRKPDRLFWVTLYDDATADSAWFADGAFTLLKQPANLWGQIDGPNTISAMVTRLVDEYSLDVPFRDILAGDPAELWLGEDVSAVQYVGEAWVEGAWTEQVAIRKPGVDFELWIRKGDEPFLAKMAVVFTEEEGRPTYLARFRKWATSVPAGSLPEFAPPPDSERLELTPVH